MWQFEVGSVRLSCRLLMRRPELKRATDAWLWRHGSVGQVSLHEGHIEAILLAVQQPEGDPLGCVLARLHYWRVSESIPREASSQAAYAKRWYNTHLGKAQASDYLTAYHDLWPAEYERRTT